MVIMVWVYARAVGETTQELSKGTESMSYLNGCSDEWTSVDVEQYAKITGEVNESSTYAENNAVIMLVSISVLVCCLCCGSCGIAFKSGG